MAIGKDGVVGVNVGLDIYAEIFWGSFLKGTNECEVKLPEINSISRFQNPKAGPI